MRINSFIFGSPSGEYDRCMALAVRRPCLPAILIGDAICLYGKTFDSRFFVFVSLRLILTLYATAFEHAVHQHSGGNRGIKGVYLTAHRAGDYTVALALYQPAESFALGAYNKSYRT